MSLENETPVEHADSERITLSLNEANFGDTFYTHKWQSAEIENARQSFSKAERAVYGAEVIWRLFRREHYNRKDAEHHPDYVSYEPLSNYDLGGLEEALTYLLEDAHNLLSSVSQGQS